MRKLPIHPALALFFFLSIVILSSPRMLSAEEEAPSTVPRVSFGVVGLYGLTGMANQASEDPNRTDGGGIGKLETGYLYGGGLVFESMFIRYLGLHVEVLYSYTFQKFKSHTYSGSPGLYYETGSYTTKTTARSIVMPVYLMPSYTYKRFTAGILLGVHLQYTFEAKMESSGRSFNAMRYINHNQLNIAGGLEFKFAVFRFVDVFVSAVAERGFSSYLADVEGSSERFYAFSARTGVLLRTF